MKTSALVATLGSLGEAISAVQQAVLFMSAGDKESCQAQLDEATNALGDGAESLRAFAESCPAND